MKRLVILIALSNTPANAMDDMEMMRVSSALAGIIGSEQLCGLTYDQAAISAYITTNVPPDRMDFAQNLQMQIMAQEYMLKDMTASAKTAHCASIAQTAKHYGFTK